MRERARKNTKIAASLWVVLLFFLQYERLSDCFKATGSTDPDVKGREEGWRVVLFYAMCHHTLRRESSGMRRFVVAVGFLFVSFFFPFPFPFSFGCYTHDTHTLSRSHTRGLCVRWVADLRDRWGGGGGGGER